MDFSKVKLTSISLILTPFLCFYSFANNDLTTEIPERIPTEELVEGIKSSDGRWFEVEMIIFKRNDNQEVREQFSGDVQAMTHRHQWDLIREALQPDISLLLSKLDECHQDSNPLLASPEQLESILFTDVMNADPAITTPLKIDLTSTELQENISTDEDLTLNHTERNTAELHQISEFKPFDAKAYEEAELFYQKVQNYKKLINQDWQFTNELCLLPNESLSGYWQFDNQLPPLTVQELSYVPITSIPTVITGGDHDDFHDVYLIAEQNLALKEQFYTLKKHPKLNPILHLGWRQPGLSKKQAKPVYIVAGDNLSKQFRYDGSEIIKPTPKPLMISDYLSDDILLNGLPPEKEKTLGKLFGTQESLLSANEIMREQQQDNLTQFMQQLESGAVVDFKKSKLIYPNQTNLPQQTFTLDGFVKVHLNHYLFVDAEFNYREQHSEQVDPNQIINIEGADVTDIALSQATDINASDLALQSEDSVANNLVNINYLKNYAFKQNRRFYSGDLHYLDHPKFGILIQIRKYRH